jgi:ATP-binding cassette subfamily C protein LapB
LYIGTPYLAGIAAIYVVLKSLHGLMIFRQAKALLQVRGFVLPGEFVSGVRQDSETAQSLGMSSWVEQRLRKLNQDQMTQNVRFHHFAIKALSDNHGLRQIGFIVWLIASADLCENSSGLSVGAWLAASLLATRAMASLSMLPLVSLQWLITTWVLLSQGRARVSDSAPQISPASETPPSLRGLVRFNEMHFSHPGQLDGLYVPRWAVQPGERIALMGEPGSGKSTLIKLMAGLFHPDSGQVLIDDKVVNQFSVQWLNEEMAYLPQSVQLLNGTLRENLLAGRSNITDEILLDLCQRIGLMPLLNAQADGLSMPLHDAHQGVSAGQRQLIGLARLFLRRPRIWLLDEPFTHLNASMRERVADLMRSQILPEQTLICSGDHAETLQMVQRVVVLGGGRIIQDGLRDQVLAHHPVQWSFRQASALSV